MFVSRRHHPHLCYTLSRPKLYIEKIKIYFFFIFWDKGAVAVIEATNSSYSHSHKTEYTALGNKKMMSYFIFLPQG